jgi:NADPH-dependent 2,4-dienoyl-CoA reductase/sulfur reductase-like enzyme/rhodanese-related sulfurtransferase
VTGMPDPSRRVLIVGGVAAGMSAATRLRRNDEFAEIIVLERGDHVSYANCGLPYYLGGVISDRDELLLQDPQRLWERFRIDVRTRHEVVAIDPENRTVTAVVDGQDESITFGYDDLVLATGADPVRPPIPGIERAELLRDVADVDRISARLDDLGSGSPAVVIGAGFIGIELAENLLLRGMNVIMIEQGDQILPPLDREMAALVENAVRAAGVQVRTGRTVVGIGDDHVQLDDRSRLAADLVIAAVGVRPNSGLARDAGLAVGVRGTILVDDEQRTSDRHVFAVGDVARKVDAITAEPAFVPLAQTANRQGRLVADVITGRPVSRLAVLGSAVVRAFGVTAAMTGWSEKRADAAGMIIRVVHTHPSDHAGYYPGAESMALKLVVDARSDRILGAQAIGAAGVDKRIDVIATAIRAGLRGADLADLELCYAPQVGSAKDPVNMIGMVDDNLAAGAVRTVQWHELDDLIEAGRSVVDVRTPVEFAGGSLPKAINIPLDQLRARFDELPDGPLVVSCAVGQRGYNAARLLSSMGREVANLDGGYRTWNAVH